MSTIPAPEGPRANNRGRRGSRKKAGKARSLLGQLLPWLGLASLVIISDQATKFQIQRSLQPGERIVVIQDWFDLTLVFNPGAAFSFLANASGWQRWFFIGIGVLATSYLLWLLIRHSEQRLFSLGLSLILGGAIGNVIDRVLQGQVVDFLLAHWREVFFWPAFNVADSAITVGAIVLILDEIRRVSRTR
jgi:signal peptidase II